MRECVAAFVVEREKILLGKRSATRRFYPDIWDVFGGHIEPNESREDALRRELLEELGIAPVEMRFLLTVDEPDRAANGDGVYHFYLFTAFAGEPRNLQPDEHERVEWFEFDEALKLPFADPLYAEMIRILRFSNEAFDFDGLLGGRNKNERRID